MKTDDAGFLDIKLVIVAPRDAAGAWLEALASVGDADGAGDGEHAGWVYRRVCTSAKLRELAIRVTGWVGQPTSDMVAGYVGADRVISDGTTELAEVSLAEVTRVVGPPTRDTLLGAIKDVLREAASAS